MGSLWPTEQGQVWGRGSPRGPGPLTHNPLGPDAWPSEEDDGTTISVPRGSEKGGPPANLPSKGGGGGPSTLAGGLPQVGGEGVNLPLSVVPTRTISGSSCSQGSREPTTCSIMAECTRGGEDPCGGLKLSKVESGCLCGNLCPQLSPSWVPQSDQRRNFPTAGPYTAGMRAKGEDFVGVPSPLALSSCWCP